MPLFIDVKNTKELRKPRESLCFGKFNERQGRSQPVICYCKEKDGSDSLAVQLADEKHWDDLVIIIAVFLLEFWFRSPQFKVSSRQKETSSTSGMRETVETSLLLQHRAKEIVPKRLPDSPWNLRLCSILTKKACFRIISLVEKWNRAEGEPQVAYTFDAGPNSVLIARNRKAAVSLLQRLLFQFPPNPETELNSYVLGDKTILQDAGINSVEDIESLPQPPEFNSSSQKFQGDVSYFICTRPGKGPVVLPESDSLLDPKTGLPKNL
ncbi:hypothetical protein Csa_018222 [Cucumis sativus]|nr:hypothetical protein Csa_018222 [Cucumis sativus]